MQPRTVLENYYKLIRDKDFKVIKFNKFFIKIEIELNNDLSWTHHMNVPLINSKDYVKYKKIYRLVYGI